MGPSIFIRHMYCIESHIVPVQYAKSSADHLSFIIHRSSDNILRNGCIHRRDDFSVNLINCSFHVEKCLQPLRSDMGAEDYLTGDVSGKRAAKLHGHDFCNMGNMVSSFCKFLIKGTVDQWSNLINGGSSSPFVNFLTVIQLIPQGDRGGADLFNTVGPVGIKIRKTKDPAVINLHLVRRPCIQRQVFNGFNLIFQNRFHLSFGINAHYIR